MIDLLVWLTSRTRRSTEGIEHPVVEGAGHFLQEDTGEELAAAIAAFLARS